MLPHHHQLHIPTTFCFHASNCLLDILHLHNHKRIGFFMGGQQKKDSQTQRRKKEIMGFTVSLKPSPSGFDLMQNCDLPPPSKFYMGLPDKSVIFSMNRVYDIAGKGEEDDGKDCGAYRMENGDDERNKMEILKALQASQTRAREAENKAAVLKKEKECLKIVLLGESMHLFAYRQQVRLLELQLLHLQQSLWLRQQPEGDEGSSKGSGHDEETGSVAWLLSLVLSFGIGVTTALSCRYYL
ncbi:hypothetical protein V8G54_020211 [Vigna mungo]|uniref:Uncharacterized protein n=1 Tax=Vigna mungo TaxID=3915 RepID=A0AAQ3NDA4_VIGMU